MKKNLLGLTALLLSATAFAQTGPVNLERFNGQGSGGAIFAQMRQVKDIKSDLPTVGSVYIDDSFRPCKIYYKDEFVGNFYYRHNSFNDEIEIKDTPYADDNDVSSLMAMRQLRLVDESDQSEVSLQVYNSKEGTLRNGYLYQLQDGPKYSLFFKNNVKFTEGTHPVTSMTRPTPNKFSHFVEYYIKKDGAETANYVSKKKGQFLSILDEDIRSQVRDYLNEEKLSLKDEADLTKILAYINSI